MNSIARVSVVISKLSEQCVSTSQNLSGPLCWLTELSNAGDIVEIVSASVRDDVARPTVSSQE
jgi:hypothetical protein